MLSDMPGAEQMPVAHLVPIVVFLVGMALVFWLVVLRPANKKARDHMDLVRSLMPGDRVVTAGGIHGVVREVHERTVELEVDKGFVLTLDKYAVRKRQDPA